MPGSPVLSEIDERQSEVSDVASEIAISEGGGGADAGIESDIASEIGSMPQSPSLGRQVTHAPVG